MEEERSSHYIVPVAIIIAGLLVAGAIMYSGGGKGSIGTAQVGGAVGTQPTGEAAPPAGLENIKAVSADDHILGNPNAPVKIVEFSDLECPFCQRFHITMKQIMDEYGKDGKVAWVYRHFPLTQIHSKAQKEAEATECAAELGGNEAFWAYVDKVFEITPANNGLDPNLLPQIAADIGLDREAFSSCLESGKYASKVAEQAQDAATSGARGTPYSVIVGPDGKKVPINGAQAFATVKAAIDQILQGE